MPHEAVPVVIAIVAAFGVFILALGGAQIWAGLPDRKGRQRD